MLETDYTDYKIEQCQTLDSNSANSNQTIDQQEHLNIDLICKERTDEQREYDNEDSHISASNPKIQQQQQQQMLETDYEKEQYRALDPNSVNNNLTLDQQEHLNIEPLRKECNDEQEVYDYENPHNSSSNPKIQQQQQQQQHQQMLKSDYEKEQCQNLDSNSVNINHS